MASAPLTVQNWEREETDTPKEALVCSADPDAGEEAFCLPQAEKLKSSTKVKKSRVDLFIRTPFIVMAI